MKARDAARQSAITELRKCIKPGDTLFTKLEHVSRSGMSRVIQVVQIKPASNGYEPPPADISLPIGDGKQPKP